MSRAGCGIVVGLLLTAAGVVGGLVSFVTSWGSTFAAATPEEADRVFASLVQQLLVSGSLVLVGALVTVLCAVLVLRARRAPAEG